MSTNFFEELVSDIAESFLEIIVWRHFRTEDKEREVVPAGEPLDEAFVEVGCTTAQSVVDMGEDDMKVVFSLEISKNIEKADAIRSAGDAENEGVSMIPKLVRRRKVLYATNQAPPGNGEVFICDVLR